METIIQPTTSSIESVSFEVTEITTVLVDNIAVGEVCLLERLGPSGEFVVMTNKDGAVYLSAYPNTILLDANGTYRVHKFSTELPASVAYVNASNVGDDPQAQALEYSYQFDEAYNSMYLPLL